jgi:hypothetical protein
MTSYVCLNDLCSIGMQTLLGYPWCVTLWSFFKLSKVSKYGSLHESKKGENLCKMTKIEFLSKYSGQGIGKGAIKTKLNSVWNLGK